MVRNTFYRIDCLLKWVGTSSFQLSFSVVILLLIPDLEIPVLPLDKLEVEDSAREKEAAKLFSMPKSLLSWVSRSGGSADGSNPFIPFMM